MQRTMLEEISAHQGKTVTVQGWVSKVRDLGKVRFVLLRDRSGVVQIVMENLDGEGMRAEDVISVEGKVVPAEKAPGGVEIQATGYQVMARTAYDLLPFAVHLDEIQTGLESILDHRMLSLRNRRVVSVFKVQHQIADSFREFFSQEQFTQIHTSKIVASGTEGGTELFEIDYFGRKAYLAQSPQLYKQMMVGAGLERVFEIGHVYRAEPHDTSRHINEYVSMDIEMGFIKDEQDLMEMETRFLQFLFKRLKEKCPQELELYGVQLPEITKIPRMELSDAQVCLKKEFGKGSPAGNLDSEGEKLLWEYAKKTWNSDFVFVTGYPAVKRPFYAMPDSEGKGLTKSFDLLYRGLEITTGGQRIHEYEHLRESIRRHGMNPDSFGFYLDVFRYGMPPHGGFAIGLERLTMKILGLDNVRQATLLPRDRSRITP